MRIPLLPEEPRLPATIAARLREDYESFAAAGLPISLESDLLERYGLDVAAEYAGLPIRNPWGKGSGQLSMTAHQVQEDVAAQLGFVVLKTVIAQDATGMQSMDAWAIRESRMLVEPIVGDTGERGWTVTWKGRGWWQSFDDYLQLIRDAQRISAERGTLIVPSCKYHLPGSLSEPWKQSEYDWTTPRLAAAWSEGYRHFCDAKPLTAMPLEMDFSPTLAGSDRAAAEETILSWLQEVPSRIRASMTPLSEDQPSAVPLRVGLKLFNSLFDDEFQLAMLRSIHGTTPEAPDFFVYGNRLFDPHREFDGHRGAAYGGPDLSHRNLRVMRRFRQRPITEYIPSESSRFLPWSATGNITTGRTALEYALCGASSFQLHTYFQLPLDQYSMRTGNRTERALHELYFHPQCGFVAWMHHLAAALSLPLDPLRFADVVGRVNDLRE